ncbi:MAG: 2-C-methyl-D-erythritol 2,4-cyclodiphosphate synthase [Terrimicrobiaceae bacterium]|nr:2-C-methyl-D-erythritol 2,4-cyclodiphosphate synthase [Terrimicrobiaceae bacterium]
MIPRSGIGYDVHRFAHGRRLVLGGVAIPHECGLEGHSDADVLSHAIADALLGAAGLRDIGHHFPPGDPATKGMDSLLILRRVAGLLKERGAVIYNVDATIVAEAPRIAPHLEAMKTAIGGALGISTEQVGVKATTNEEMGSVGRGEGIAALATACVGCPPPA